MTGEMRLENDVVAKSLSQMGDAAIPATRVLLESQAPRDRRRGVLILRNIGTPAARRLLQEHLPNENDPTNKQLIENGLDLQK
jgi:mRNA-degrading endonuclease toxin of MazEF toxin-antitoxin module